MRPWCRHSEILYLCFGLHLPAGTKEAASFLAANHPQFVTAGELPGSLLSPYFPGDGMAACLVCLALSCFIYFVPPTRSLAPAPLAEAESAFLPVAHLGLHFPDPD